ncbi:MAG: hypothetical protein M3O88_08680, partial [Actinomycetota bacterium]|nr:hypothetical protein [Actinomycetota bacterium]
VPEISRVIGLLLAAQADMRWTTSPRLTLELALIRATVPEADPQPQALFSRIERLERLAGVPTGPAAGAEGAPPSAPAAQPERSPAPKRKNKSEEKPPEEVVAEVVGVETEVANESSDDSRSAMSSAPAVPLSPSAGDGPTPNVDVEMLRRSWPSLLEHLWAAHEPVLKANLEVATPVGYDGAILELAFPPERRFGVAKVEGKQAELQGALQELFGISPMIKCIVRAPVAGPPAVDDDDPPLSEEEVIARVRAELGASDITPGPEGS